MVEVLDCTLRDGGYVNNWSYSKAAINAITSGVVASGIEYLELGFLCDTKPQEATTLFTSIKEAEDLLSEVTTDCTAAVMIELGKYDTANIVDKEDGGITTIRLIFRPQEVQNGLLAARQLKDKGYKIFINPIAITSYSDAALLQLIAEVNKIKPYAFSIVDTYGLLYPGNALRYFSIVDDALDSDVKIGAHFHNDLQLAFANCITTVNAHRNHHLILDSTCYGMGKRAGNVCTELLCHYLNTYAEKHYDVNAIVEVISSCMQDIRQKTPWGYDLSYYVAAMQKVHPSYISFMEDVGTLSVTEQLGVLTRLPEEYKYKYNESLIKELITSKS